MKIKPTFFYFLLFGFGMFQNSFAQTQLQVINGIAVDESYGSSVSIAADGSRISTVGKNGTTSWSSINAGRGIVHHFNTSTQSYDLNTGLFGLGPDISSQRATLSADGSRIINLFHSPVSSSSQIGVYEYDESNNSWNEIFSNLSPTNNYTGTTISGDGNRIVVAFPDSTEILEWNNLNSEYEKIGDFISKGQTFEMSHDGNRLVLLDTITVPSSRNVFEWNAIDSEWNQISFLTDDEFKSDISISSDGSRIAWSNKSFGDVYIGNITPGSTTGIEQVGTSIPLEGGFVSAKIDLSSDGNRVVISEQASNQVTRLFDFNGTDWVETGSMDFSGGDVKMTDEGDRIIIGNPNFETNIGITGQVRLYDFFLGFGALPGLCSDAMITNLGGGFPLGGVYSGPGVSDFGNGITFDFDPSISGSGIHTITYIVSGISLTSTIEVFAAPNVTFASPGCYDLGANELSSLSGGSPVGGTYSGTGVTDNGDGTFSVDLMEGLVSVDYFYTDINGCSGASSASVSVFLPTATLSLNGGGNNIVVPPGVMVSATGDYSTSSPSSCSGCNQQLIIGLESDGVDCIYDGNAALCTNSTTGIYNTIFTSPMIDGVYNIYVNNPYSSSCDLADYTGTNGNNVIMLGTITVDQTISTKVVNKLEGLVISPNPVSDQFTIETFLSEQSDLSIRLYNTIGQIVFEEDLFVNSGLFNQTFNIENLGSGIYLCEIKSGLKSITQKLIIQR